MKTTLSASRALATLLCALLCIGDALHLRTEGALHLHSENMMEPVRRSQRLAAQHHAGMDVDDDGPNDPMDQDEHDPLMMPMPVDMHADPNQIGRRGRKRRSGAPAPNSRQNAKSKRTEMVSSPHGTLVARMQPEILRKIAESARGGGDAEVLWKMRSANREALRAIDGDGNGNPLPGWPQRSANLGKSFHDIAGKERDVTVDIVLMSPKPPHGGPLKLAECLDVKVKGVQRDMTWGQFAERVRKTQCTLRQPLAHGMLRENHVMPVIKEGFAVEDIIVNSLHAELKKICLKQPRSPWPMWEEAALFRDGDGNPPFRVGDHDQQLTPETIPPFLPPSVAGRLEQWRAQPSAGKSLAPANLRNMPQVKVVFETPDGWNTRNLQSGAQ